MSEMEMTPAIEKANRLQALLAHPGWPDIIQISVAMVREAANAIADYPGWDTQQILVLKCRLQAAKEYHTALIGEIMNAIQSGIEEAKALTAENTIPAISAQEALDRADFVRTEALKQIDQIDVRIPGSY